MQNIVQFLRRISDANFDVIAWELTFELQTYTQSVLIAPMYRIYSPIDL